MKFLALTVLFSFSAMAACPELAGTFKSCKASTGEVKAGPTVTQTLTDGVTTYTVTSEQSGVEMTQEYIADGVLRVDSMTDDSGAAVSTENQTACVGPALTIKVKITQDNEVMANLVSKITKKGTKLTTITTGKMWGHAIKLTEVCE